MIDVYDPSQVVINLFESSDDCKVSLYDVEFTKDDYILYSGTPSFSRQGVTQDELYLESEFFCSFMAFLYQYRKQVLFYPNEFSRSLNSKQVQLSILNTIGWDTPSYTYKSNLSKGTFTEELVWPTDFKNRDILFITKSTYDLFMSKTFVIRHDIERLILKTQRFLQKNDIEFVTLPIASFENRFYAFGLSVDLPKYFPDEVLDAFIFAYLPYGVYSKC